MGHHTHGPSCGCSEEDKQRIDGEMDDSLLPYVHPSRVRSCNARPASGEAAFMAVFRAHAVRLTEPLPPPLTSVDDEQMLFHVDFTSHVHLRSFTLIGPPGLPARAPCKVRLFANREDLDLGNVDTAESSQDFELPEDATGESVIVVRPARFSGIHSLTIYVESVQRPRDAGGVCELRYLQLRGVFARRRTQPIVTVYELRPNLADHSVSWASGARAVQ